MDSADVHRCRWRLSLTSSLGSSPCPVPQPARHRLRGARAATAGPPQLPAPLTVRRRVSVRGAIMIGGQRIQAGLPHAGKTVQVTVESDTYQITVEDGL